MAFSPDQVHVRNRKVLHDDVALESTTEDVHFSNSRRGVGVNFDHREN
jgi:hypothetical protein